MRKRGGKKKANEDQCCTFQEKYVTECCWQSSKLPVSYEGPCTEGWGNQPNELSLGENVRPGDVNAIIQLLSFD